MNLYKYHTNPKSLLQSDVKYVIFEIDLYDMEVTYEEAYETKLPKDIGFLKNIELPKSGNRLSIIRDSIQPMIHDIVEVAQEKVYTTKISPAIKKWVNWANENASKVMVANNFADINVIIAVR